MTSSSCHRLWQVEAARDGRLSERDKSSFEAHARECRVCSREQRRLERLAEKLRELEPPANEVTLYHGRQKLMKALDARVRQQPSEWSAWRVWGLSACAALALLLLGLWTQHERTPPRTFVHVSALGAHAHWSRLRAGDTELIQLSDDGVFDIRIQRQSKDPRVQVLLPDGTIDDLGTVFQVSLHNRLTVQLVVSEGAVVFHRRAAEDVYLAAGHVWRPEQPAAPEAAAVKSAQSSLQPTSTLQMPQPPELPTPQKPARVAVPSPRRTAPRVKSPPAILREDVAYLHVLSLLRSGHDFEAQLEAIDYLRRFPHGFRSAEIERIATGR